VKIRVALPNRVRSVWALRDAYGRGWVNEYSTEIWLLAFWRSLRPKLFNLLQKNTIYTESPCRRILSTLNPHVVFYNKLLSFVLKKISQTCMVVQCCRGLCMKLSEEDISNVRGSSVLSWFVYEAIWRRYLKRAW
jgi:hypothetical protein